MDSISDIVLFGIRAGLKLSRQARIAYVEATISKQLVLPLPDFNPQVNETAAVDFFRGAGKVYLKDNPELKGLFQKAKKGNLSSKERIDFINSYLELKLLDDVKLGLVKPDASGFTPEALNALVTVRQWARGKSPYPSGLQRILGTLIEIGIDYFSNKSDLINEDTAIGKAIKGFLKSLDDLDFKTEAVDRIVRTLFIASLECIQDNTALVSGDEKVQSLIESVSKAVIIDLKERTEALSDTDLSLWESIVQTGQLIFKTTLSAAAEVVLDNPGTYLGIKDASEQAIVSSVTRSVLGVILDEDSVDLKSLFTAQSLKKVLRAVLITVSEYPELMGVDHKALRKILSAVTRQLAQETEILDSNILPEVMRLIIEKTTMNIELLWPEQYRDMPEKHLLITASKELLSRLAAKKKDTQIWSPRLSKTDIVDLLEVVLDEIVENPDWLIKDAYSEDTNLGILVDTVLDCLSRVPEPRIGPELFKAVFLSVIEVVALRHELIEVVTVDGSARVPVGLILDAVFEAVFSDSDGKARWVLARQEILNLIISTILNAAVEKGFDETLVEKIKKVLFEIVDKINSKQPWSMETIISEIEQEIQGGTHDT